MDLMCTAYTVTAGAVSKYSNIYIYIMISEHNKNAATNIKYRVTIEHFRK